jgi:hypothetical protein
MDLDDDEDFDPVNWFDEWGVYGTVEWKWKRIRKVVHTVSLSIS